jgi:hypothetical protein
MVHFLQPLKADSAGSKVRDQKPDISKLPVFSFVLNCLKIEACIAEFFCSIGRALGGAICCLDIDRRLFEFVRTPPSF